MKTENRILKSAIVCMVCAGSFFSCKEDETPEVQYTFYGQEVKVGDGTVKSEVKLNSMGTPESVSIIFTERVLANLPGEMKTYELTLPSQAVQTPFNHLTFDWNPHGHSSDGVYNLPHFDMHFYMISKEIRMSIGEDDPKAEKLPGEGYMPVNYVPFPGYVPMMGKHWGDPFSPELNGETFTKTFLMGSYDEKTIFYEPMMTVAYLEEKNNEEINLSVPQLYHETGKYYPVKYSVSYDVESKEYAIRLLGFVKR